MGWNNSDEIVVAQNGQVFFAPVGTDLPTDIDDVLNGAFVGTGYVNEEGAALSVAPEISEVKAWQSRQAVRRDLVGQDIQLTFALKQFNEENLPLAFGGGEVTAAGGGFRYDFPQEGDALQERALVVEAVDGDTKFLFVFPRGNVTEAVELQLHRTDSAELPITFKALEPTDGGPAAYVLTNSPGFAAGS